MHLRHVHPLPNGLEKIFADIQTIVVVEMNDQGVYGFGQFATILRARYCEPKIESVTKTDGLTFRVKEILEGVFEGRSFAARNIPREGPADRSRRHLGRKREDLERSRPARRRLEFYEPTNDLEKLSAPPAKVRTAAATKRAAAKVPDAVDRAGDNTPTSPGRSRRLPPAPTNSNIRQTSAPKTQK